MLLATAKRLFLSEGYHATSIETVAAAAGFTRGAVYSAFGGKEQLCLAVMDEIFTDELGAVVKALSGPGTLEERLDAFEEWALRMVGAEGWTSLTMDFISAARHQPEVQAEMAAQAQRIREMIAAVFSYQARAFGLAPALVPDALGVAVFGLIVGVGLQRLLDPAISARIVVDSVRALLDPTHANTQPRPNGSATTTSRDNHGH